MKNEKIAVIMKECGKIDSLLVADKIRIYEKQDAGWEYHEEHYVNIDDQAELVYMRSELQKIIHKLNDCRIIAGGEISGIVYNEFNRFGYSIFEIPEISSEIFDGIVMDIIAAEETAAHSKDIKMTQPTETSVPGVYYLDLIKLQMESPEISSKKALKEFLDNTPFYELQLLCEHIPPWLSTEIFDIADSKTDAGKTLAVIRIKQCGGDKK